MFKNIQLYRLKRLRSDAVAWFDGCMSYRQLQPCGAAAMQSLGWVVPRSAGTLVQRRRVLRRAARRLGR